VNAPVGSRDQVYNSCTVEPITVRLLELVTCDDIMTSLLKKVINIGQNPRTLTVMESLWSVSKLSTESVGSRRELVANSVHTADADATRLDS